MPKSRKWDFLKMKKTESYKSEDIKSSQKLILKTL